MKRINSCFSCFLLITFLSFIFHTQVEASTVPFSKTEKFPEILKKIQNINRAKKIQNINIDDLLTMDEVFDLLESLQNDDLEEIYTEEELKSINTFLIFLARQGVLPENEEQLEKDIEKLLLDEDEEEYSFFSPLRPPNSYDTNYQMHSTQENIILCTNIFKQTGRGIKKGVKETGRFIKDNWVPIVIGVTAVAAGAVTYYVVSSDSPEEPASPVPDQNTLQTPNENSFNIQEGVKDIQSQDISSNYNPENDNSLVTKMLEENVHSFKIQENNNFSNQEKNPTFWDNTKNLSSHFAHQILDEVSDYAKIIPGLIDEATGIYDRIVPEDLSFSKLKEDPEKSITQSYEEKIFKGHQKIDQVCSTNESGQFTKEAKEAREKDWSIAFLPPPDGIFKCFNFKKFSNAGKIPDRENLTKAGRALAKHGGREGSVFPKPLGSPEQINQQGQ